MAEIKLNSTLAQKIMVNPELTIMQIAPIGWDIPDFKPGQYCAVGVMGSASRCANAVPEPEDKKPKPDKLISRAYSVASAPSNKAHLELYITLVKEGGLTPRLMHLNVGDNLWTSPRIVGTFTMEGVPEDANLIFMSTGTGLAPYMSMIREHLLENTKRKIAVLNGVRHSWDLGYRSELEILQDEHEHFTYIPTVSRAKQETAPWTGRTGYCQEVWKERLLEKLWGIKLNKDNTHLFLCGNPGMIEEMEKLAQSEGFLEHSRKSPGQIHVEKYW